MKTDYIWAERQGSHRWWRVLAVLLMTLIPTLIIASAGQFLVLQPILESLSEEQEALKMIAFSVYAALLFGVAIVMLTLGVKHIHKRDPRTLFGASNRFSAGGVFFGFAVYASLMFGATLVSDSQSLISAVTDKGVGQLALTAIPLCIAFLIQGSGEEILMRGYLPQVLNRILKRPVLAIFLPALLFAALHAGYGLNSFINSGLFAVFAVVVVLKRGNLSEICGAHAANNFMILWLLSDIETATEASGWTIDIQSLLSSVTIYGAFFAIMMLRDARKLRGSQAAGVTTAA